MTLVDILLTTIIITLFCLGVRQLLSEGMILHFIRKPFEQWGKYGIMYMFKGECNSEKIKKNQRISTRLSFILKPFILCVVCFASVWGGFVFIALHGFLPIPLVICCVSSTFLIRVINDKMDW